MTVWLGLGMSFWLILALGLLVLAVGIYHSVKPLPSGLNYSGASRPARNVRFLSDTSYVDPDGQRHLEQSIFDEVFAMIESAERFILLDMFLFNAFQGDQPERHRALSGELADRLLARKLKAPGLRIQFITDPVNTLYGGLRSPHLEQLEAAGVEVVVTRLEALRDSNPLYSSVWRTFFAHWGSSTGTLLKNPLGEGRISLRSLLVMPNFKANHRKVIIVDQGSEYSALVTSANPHDGSSAHGNVALRFDGPAVVDLLGTEEAVLAFSTGKPAAPRLPEPMHGPGNDTGIRVVTEYAIKRAVLDAINTASVGSELDIAMFYLTDRDIIVAMITAFARKVQIRLLLDPSKEAFGIKKNGIPNRQTAFELQKAGIPVRWAITCGEQSHSKFLMLRDGNGHSTLVLGSANFTRRNLENLNLETSVVLTGNLLDLPALKDAATWFGLRWHNTAGRHYSVDYKTFADHRLGPRLLYRVQEATGLCTF